MPLESVGKLLLVMGIVVALLGLVLVLGSRVPWLGRLPGDVLIRRDNVSFYAPLVTFFILSVVLTVMVNVVLWLLRR